MARFAAGHRMFGLDNSEKENISAGRELAINIPDHVFGFLDEESEGSSFGSNNDDEGENPSDDKDNNEDGENPSSDLENKKFWDTQNQLLQATLCRTSSLESKIRNITREAVKEEEQQSQICICICGKNNNNNNNKKKGGGGCRNCLMKEICLRLQNSSFNSAICKSKWKSTPNIASGEHTFVDVVEKTNTSTSSKKGEVRVIIELNFRGEFEMGRASEEYNELIKKLPEVFVGKTERLLSLIKILSSAAKKCMKDQKMHLGPWRRQRYMQAKWFKVCQRTTALSPLSTLTGGRSPVGRPRTRSMLTVDLMENLPTHVHRTAVAVL